MDTAIWDAEAMDIISAGAAATGTTTVGATGTGTMAGGATDTIIAGTIGTITAAGGNRSEKGRQVGGSFLRARITRDDSKDGIIFSNFATMDSHLAGCPVESGLGQNTLLRTPSLCRQPTMPSATQRAGTI